MNNLFTLAANETSSGSLFFLNSIFGPVGNVLGGTGPAILGTMFQVFNTTVLALGSLIVTYTTVMSIILTAHEGDALGKRFHGLWTPIRTVLGIAALVPTSTGYSYLQIGLMWFILQGVGAADTLWTTTVNYVAAGNTTAPQAPGNGSTAGLQLQMGLLFESLVCQAAANARYGSGYFCSDNASNSFCTIAPADIWNVSAGSPQVTQDASGNLLYNMGPGSTGECGQLVMGNPSTPAGQAQIQAWQQIIPTVLGPLATQMVTLDNGYSNFINYAGTPPPPPPTWVTQYCSDHNLQGAACNPTAFSSYPVPTVSNANKSGGTVTDLYWQYGLSPTAGGNFIATAANLYYGIVSNAAQNNSGNGSNSLASVLNAAIDNGWIFAGGFFYYIAQANSTTSANLMLNMNKVPPDVTSLADTAEQALTTAAQKLVNFVGQTTSSSSTMGGAPISCGSWTYGAGGDALCTEILQSWVGNLSGSSGANLTQNPVIAAQSYGNEILDIMEIAIPLVFLINLGIGLLGGIYVGEGPFTAAAVALVQTIVPAAMFIILIFLGLGITLAVYTPLIPYMLFTFGAINWLIATVETMLAAPLVAIGLLHPEGGENIWGKAEQALMLMLNIFLRPSLMIFGMIAGMLMSYTVVMMINYAFLNVISMVSNGGANIIELIFFMVIYTSIFTTSISKCFDLIHVIPDKILRWISGGEQTFGSGGGIESIKGAVDSGSSKASEVAQGVASTGGKMGEAAGKEVAAGKAEMKKAETKAADQKALANLIKGGGGGP